MRNVVELGDGVAAFDADWHLLPRLTDECKKVEGMAFGIWCKVMLLASISMNFP